MTRYIFALHELFRTQLQKIKDLKKIVKSNASKEIFPHVGWTFLITKFMDKKRAKNLRNIFSRGQKLKSLPNVSHLVATSIADMIA